MTKKWVYAFNEGDGKNKKLLGGKGANLCEMTQIGLRVPPGFVITTEACLAFLENPKRVLPEGVMDQVHTHLAEVEKKSGRKFGGRTNPLLVSVRSGSAMSMPGMMDTILNLGLNAETLQGLIAQTGNERFCYDAYRRFIQLFGKVALGVPEGEFDEEFNAVKAKAGARHDVDLSAKDLAEISERFLAVVNRSTGRPFPSDPHDQLEIAIRAVFNSWMGKRAVDYRREFKITPDMANGTAVNVVRDGLWQHGQGLCNRCRVHPRPGHRRECPLWRIPGKCPGRGCGCRYPYTQTGCRHGRRDARTPPPTASTCATSSKPITRKSRTSSSPSRKVRSTASRPETAR